MLDPILALLQSGPSSGGSRATPIILGAVGALLAAILFAAWRRRSREARAAEGSAAEAGPEMGEKQFWRIVAVAKDEAGADPLQRASALLGGLRELEAGDIARFDARYRAVRARADQEHLRLAAHVIRDGCDDVTFVHFRDWLISEGEHTFRAAVRDPETLAELGRRELTVLEAYGYAAKRAYKAKAGAQLAGTAREAAHATSLPEWDRQEAARKLPKVVAVYG